MTLLYNIRHHNSTNINNTEQEGDNGGSRVRLTCRDVQYCENLFAIFKEKYMQNSILAHAEGGSHINGNGSSTRPIPAVLQPRHLSHGRSSLFPSHAYVDLFFERSPWLVEVYKLAMEVFNFYENQVIRKENDI